MYVKNASKHWKSIHINKVSFGERICIHFLRLVFIYPHKRTQNWSTMANEMTHNFFHWLNDPSQSLLQFHIVWSRESKRHRHKSKSNDRKRNQKRNYGKWKAQKLELQNDDWLSLTRRPVFLVGFSKSYNLPHDSHIQTLFDLKKFVSENDENFHE